MVRRRMSLERKKVDEEDRTAQAHQTQRKPSVKNQRIQDDKVNVICILNLQELEKGSATIIRS